MMKSVNEIAEALTEVISISHIFHRDSETETNKILIGEKTITNIHENGRQFNVDVESGQKTGFFIDQRENRNFITQYVKDKIVLDAFSYSGGFSVYALTAGAKHVDSVDSSANALKLVEENILLNNIDQAKQQSHQSDVANFLEAHPQEHDLIILDPPAYAKSQSAKHKAVIGYKNLNAEAIYHIKPGGIIFTFSCSQHIDAALFEHTIQSAAIEVGRSVRVFHHFSQPADHPVNIFHPEGEYLKGLGLFVE